MRSIFSSIAVIVAMLLLDCPCMAGDDAIIYFTPQNFTFTVKVADDGTGTADGWQESKSGLIFGPTPSGGTVCIAVVGMPLRNSAWGKIPTNVAPTYTSKVANAAAAALKKNGSFNLPPGIFCSTFEREMDKQWGELYPYMGTKVKVKSP